MIVDWQKYPEVAELYDVVNAADYSELPHREVFYADDSAGMYRYYLTDAMGFPAIVSGPDGEPTVAAAEVRAPIRIVRKPEGLFR